MESIFNRPWFDWSLISNQLPARCDENRKQRLQALEEDEGETLKASTSRAPAILSVLESIFILKEEQRKTFLVGQHCIPTLFERSLVKHHGSSRLLSSLTLSEAAASWLNQLYQI